MANSDVLLKEQKVETMSKYPTKQREFSQLSPQYFVVRVIRYPQVLQTAPALPDDVPAGWR